MNCYKFQSLWYVDKYTYTVIYSSKQLTKKNFFGPFYSKQDAFNKATKEANSQNPLEQ